MTTRRPKKFLESATTPSPLRRRQERPALTTEENRTLSTPDTTFGRIRYRPGGSCGPRIQRDYQLVVIHSGSCKVTVKGVQTPLAIGHAYLFRPGHEELFEFSETGESTHSWCSVRPESLPASMRRQLDQAPPKATLSLLLKSMLRSTLDDGSITSPAGVRVVDQLGACVFSEYLRGCEREGLVPRDQSVTTTLQYLETHLGDPDCLRKALRASACSRSALLKRFRESVGQTPGRILWQLRVDKGIGMLRNTGLTIAEISDQCGFANPFHFSRRIRSTTGVSPRALRQEAWGKPAPQ